jgi:hypothetical protein
MIEFDQQININELSLMGNRLFCTFSTEDNLDNMIQDLQKKYTILYNKIFVLYCKSENEYAITYNVDLGNVSSFVPGSILVHRKKDTKTLYTINALNALIRSLNNGQLDVNYQVKWEDYRNCILLTKGPELKKLSTQLYKIVEL